MNQNKVFIFSIIFVFGLIALFLFFQKPSSELTGFQHRESIEQMFNELPEPPEDFFNVSEGIKSGSIINLENVSEEYYLQPEFYPNFEEQLLPYLLNPPEGRFGAYGLMSYPSQTVVTTYPGENFTVYFFMASSVFIEFYQGNKLTPVYNSELKIIKGSFPDGTNIIKQDTEKARQFIDVKFTPEVFVLSPTYPEFTNEWSKKIRMDISIPYYAEPGKYTVSVIKSNTPTEKGLEWKEKYGKYTEGGMESISTPYYSVFLEIK